jgi:hypothetical protein
MKRGQATSLGAALALVLWAGVIAMGVAVLNRHGRTPGAVQPAPTARPADPGRRAVQVLPLGEANPVALMPTIGSPFETPSPAVRLAHSLA